MTPPDCRSRTTRSPSTYTSETWEPPSGCVARQWDGTPLNAQALPPASETCVEAPMVGFQARPSDTGTSGTEFNGSTVNGNYGFASSEVNLYPPGDPDNPGCTPRGPADHLCTVDSTQLDLYAPLTEPQYLRPDDYIVSIDLPDNPVGGGKKYQVTQGGGRQRLRRRLLPARRQLPGHRIGATGGIGGSGHGTPEAPPSQGNGFTAPCVGPCTR